MIESLREFVARYWSVPSATIGAAAGAVGSHVWRRFQARMVVLRWTASHQILAVSGEDARFGRVTVLYNDEPVSNLKWCLVELENESNRDLVNVEVNLSYGDGTQVLDGGGWVEGSTHQFDFTEKFAGAIARLSALSDAEREADPDIAYLRTHRDYVIPVLNRSSRAGFTFLVHAVTGPDPTLSVSCDHPGMRLRMRARRPMLGGVAIQDALVVGLVVGLVTTFTIGVSARAVVVAAWAGFALGAFSGFVGVGVLRGMRWIVRVLG